ncbi:MAG TPA: hypothetical protein VFN71_02290 [Methylomirabilota bacterium]|nr:hypothetical protein [Methylomirabilota bacterium]
MALRAAPLPLDSAALGLSPTVAVRRAALWGLLLSTLVAGWGVQWDIQWHVLIGRDSFWIPPHVMTYTGVSLMVLLSFGVLAWETVRGAAGPGPVIRALGLAGTRGFHLAAWGIAITVLAAPIDDLWHRLFGLDVTLWSPPHLMGLAGSAVNTLGCLVIARECYPARSRARLAALILAGALLYGNLHFMVDPSGRIAYLYGGVRFYTFAVLSALLLPAALVTTARLSDRRWAPVALLAVGIVIGTAGHQIARVGFEILRPVSVIEEEIAKDPASPIAIAMEMARKDGRVPGRTGGRAYLFALIPIIVLALVDARRRPVGATLAYTLTLFAVAGWLLAHRPSLAPMAPGLGPTSVALGLTAVSAGIGGWVARALSDALAAEQNPRGA